MKAPLAIIAAASLGLLFAGAPALAQDPAPTQISVPPPPDSVGNPQLRNFSLGGTVTQRATGPAQAEPAPRQESARQQVPRQQAPYPQAPSQQAPSQQLGQPAQPRQQQAPPATPVLQSLEVVPTPPSAPAQMTGPGALPPQADVPPTWDAPAPVAAAASFADSPYGGISIFPWLLAALFFGGAAAWYFLRQRPRESYSGAGAIDLFEAQPAPAPRPAPPATKPPSPAPRPSAAPRMISPSGGVVSTRLRPWLEIEFVPQRGIVDELKAAVAFEVSIFNSGSVPAREILVEASLFNAGSQQDQEIQQFFDNPVAKGDRIPVIPPLQRVTIETAVFLQREMVVPIEIEGRALFVPIIGFNVLYSWGKNDGQSSASYLVGKQTKSEKLAPFRLDLGPRIFRNLAARDHELRVRK
jgi:hypothetical protein